MPAAGRHRRLRKRTEARMYWHGVRLGCSQEGHGTWIRMEGQTMAARRSHQDNLVALDKADPVWY